MQFPPFLEGGPFRLLLFGGKGGAGKTTCAAAAAWRLAERFPRRSFLLLSTDPAHSLADSLAGDKPPDNCRVLELDAALSLQALLLRRRGRLRQIASAGSFLEEQDLDRLLDLSLPGLDELAAFAEISTRVEQQEFDCVVVDTAPSGHALRLLETPELMSKWLGALDAMLAKHRYLRQVFGRSGERDELDLFLEEWAGSVRRMEALLADPAQCRFVVVMLAERLCVEETVGLLGELRRRRLPLAEVVVNRLWPHSSCPACEAAEAGQLRELAELFQRLDPARYAWWGLPLQAGEVRGGEALRSFWNRVAPLDRPTVRAGIPERRPLGSRVEAAEEPPAPEIRLLVVGGKGGTGKTTLACATAIWLAKHGSGAGVLLLSTDPAHSVSHCLDFPVGATPTRIFPGLAAMELDARGEFRTLQASYAADLERFLSALSPHLDLTFDRQVMERLLDLAPAGLDEMMALSRVADLLASGRYGLVVLDSAATGHLIRLLELPALLEAWLKVVFDLLLKYQRAFRLPRLTDRLVRVSKSLKTLQKLLADPAGAHLYAVSIPAEMALEETKDLVAACQRLKIHVPRILVNLVTPPQDCSLCSALHRYETGIRKRFERAFPNQDLTIVYRQNEVRGLARLEELGQALYCSVVKESMCYVS